MRTSALLLAVTLCSCLVACDSGGSEKKADPAAEAKAKEEEDKQKRIEERRKKREAEQKAEEDAAAAKKAKIDALLVLPETMPKKLDKACDAVGEAQTAFIERSFDAAAAAKAKTGSTMTVKTCKENSNIEVAACQKNALDNADKELGKDLPALLAGCIEKFGTKPEGA